MAAEGWRVPAATHMATATVSTLRAAAARHHAAPHNTITATAMPDEKMAPCLQLPACHAASATVTPTSSRIAARRQPSRRRCPSPSYGRRSAASGGIRRIPRSGIAANKSETNTPTAIPRTVAGPRHLRVHVHRKKTREQSREGPLRYEAAGRPDDAAGKPHRRCLERVHDKHQSCAGAETAKHGHRLPSLANEHDDRARHADPAQEQRDQRHEPEISGESRESVVQVVLIFGHRPDLNAFRPEDFSVSVGQCLR